MKHVALNAGPLYQPFWTIKIRPGRQEGAKMATLQEKTPQIDPKNVSSQKSPRILNFFNKFLNPHIKPVILARANISGH